MDTVESARREWIRLRPNGGRGIRLRTRKTVALKPVASRGAGATARAGRLASRCTSTARTGDPHRRFQRSGLRETRTAPDWRRRWTGQPVPRPHRRRANLQAGIVSGGDANTCRSHTGDRNRRDARRPAHGRAGRQDPRLLPRPRASTHIAEALRQVDAGQNATGSIKAFPPSWSWRNGGTARDHVLIRGMYDRPANWSRRCRRRRWCRPRILTPNRLGFARWLVDPSIP